jgi:predicted metal-dependent hydrolase
MMFAEKAFQKLFPEKEVPKIKVRYSGRMGPYNSNVTYRGKNFTFSLSREWKEIDESIKKGLVQSLLMRVYKTKVKRTHYTDLYDSFMKHLHRSTSKDKNDPELEASFERVNDKYLSSTLERPNLEWGGYTKRVLGNYNYHTDSIKISSFFKEAPQEMLDYIMYHELLHKKIKFSTSGGRSQHHTKEFRDMEKKYPGFHGMDDKIHNFLVYKRKPRGKKEVKNSKDSKNYELEPKKKNKQFSLFSWLR